MMRLSTVFLLFLLAALIAAQPNYQERAIYIGKDDNPCVYSTKMDTVMIIVKLSDREIIRDYAWSSTGCIPDILVPEKAIRPSTFIHYISMTDDYKIYLDDAPRYESYQGLLFRIVERTTINWIRLNGKTDYNCVIIGDGKVQHWGIDFEDHDPATIVIECVEPGPGDKLIPHLTE